MSGREWAVEADDVCDPEQLLQRITSAREDRARAECLREARRLPPDPAGADDAERLAVEPLSEHEFERERPGSPRPDEPVSLDDPAEESQSDSDRELRGRLRQHVRGIGDHDAAPPRRLQVDVVDPDAVVCDDLELWPGALQVGVVDHGVDQGEDSLRFRRIRDELEVLFERL